ncbi:MAG: phosphoglycerate dehydrogenase [Bacteroidota bacterium]
MIMKILICDGVEKTCSDVLRAEGFDVDEKPKLPPEEFKACLGEYEGLIVRSATKVTVDVLAAAKRLKVVGRAGAGVDNIDIDGATRKGIVVMNTPGGNTISTAEHTVSMLLSLSRNIPQAFESLRTGKWERGKYVGTEVHGKTIGIIGLGKIGREVAVRCRAFGMVTIGFDPVLSPEVALKLGIELVPLVDLYRKSDFISVHTPLNDETRGMVGDRELEQCKRGVRVINCARGGIVDEDALLRGLEKGWVAGAAFDVFSKEPPGDHPLLHHPKVIATPHLGASTEEAQEKVAHQIAVQVADFLKERGMAGAVNGEVIQLAMRTDLKGFVRLSEKLGTLIAQLMKGTLKGMTITCSGEVLSSSTTMIRAAVLKGLFSHLMSEPVNLVNAPAIAAEAGLKVTEVGDSERGSYLHLIAVDFETDREKRRIAGTVFGERHMRIVAIDGYHLEFNPEGHLLVYTNVDRPGMLASVGSLLASAKINIAGVALGRNRPGERAMTIMSVDSPISADTLKALGSVEGVLDVRSVFLQPGA